MVMADKASLSGGGIGIIFLALALFNFLTGDDWVAWAIIGVLFGGLSAFRMSGGTKSS
jgi:Na+/H+ antiporter NhaC